MSARAGKSRFFIGLASLLIMIGFVAIFHSSQQQLDESRELRLRCEQQQEALNTRLQAIVEHKFKIEKALEAERREHLETKQHFEQKTKEQKDIHNKAVMELNIRFESLQQHYKLLQSEHNDLVEDNMKTKESQLEEINGLKGKIKSLQSQIKQMQNQHGKAVEEWKLKYDASMQEKQRLDTLLRASTTSCKRTNENHEKLIMDYKKHCDYRPQHENSHFNTDLLSNRKDGIQRESNQVKGREIQKNFKEQQTINDGLYKIDIRITNNTNNMLHETTNTKHLEIGEKPINGIGSSSPNNNNHPPPNVLAGAIINSVENFQIAPNLLMSADDTNNIGENKGNENRQVLQQPPPLDAPIKSSTASSPLKTSDNKSNRPEALYASIAHPTSEKNKRSTSTLANDRHRESGGRLRSKQLPIGVAPVPENFEALIKNDENNQNENNSNNNNNNNNNRYANVVDELSGKKDDTEQDNGAHEIKDDINVGDEKNDHLREVLDNVNNAAEEDANNFLDSKGLGGRQKKDNEDVEVIGNNKRDKADNLLEGDDKLINEVVGDQGKEAAFPDGMHLEEGNEEDEDEDDYSNPAARQQEGPAIRN